MKSYDSIVIGAGIAGLSVARELAKLKQRVLLLEREEKGGGASRAAAGIIDPYTEADEETPLLQLGLKAFDFYPSFLDELGNGIRQRIEYEKLGILYVALNAEDEKFLAGRFDWQKKRGISVVSVSDAEIQRMEPALSKKVRSGIYYPEIPKLNAEKLTSALFEATRSAGVEIRTSVKRISVSIKGDKIRGVEIPEGPIESPSVIIAEGCWTGLDQDLGIKIKVSAVRGQILLLRSNPSLYPRHILHTIRWAYIVPWPGEQLLIGSTLESNVGFDNRVTPEGKEDILNRVSEIMEGIRSLPVEKSWSGLRPYVDGGVPFIGPTRIPGLYLAVGYYRSGILIGPLAGKFLAEGIVSGF